jgi:uncharacterized membrane protein YhaH (DUF805 family)
MSFYLLAWQRYFDFRGHSSRPEFWIFFLVHFCITSVMIGVDVMVSYGSWGDLVYSTVSFIPMLTAMIRRLHDSGRTGWWMWVFVVPGIGPFWLVYLLTRPSGERNHLEPWTNRALIGLLVLVVLLSGVLVNRVLLLHPLWTSKRTEYNVMANIESATTSLNITTMISQENEPMRGLLTVGSMTEGQLLTMRGRVGEGHYEGVNRSGKTCAIDLPVVVGSQGLTDVGVQRTSGLKIAVMSKKLNDAILDGERIISSDWLFRDMAFAASPDETVDGYVLYGISSNEGFALNARKKWVSWLVGQQPITLCE